MDPRIIMTTERIWYIKEYGKIINNMADIARKMEIP
jgi:hypothetical protein